MIQVVKVGQTRDVSLCWGKKNVLLQDVAGFRAQATECGGKLSVRDRSSAPQPILRWGTICFELCAGFKHRAAMHQCGSDAFLLNQIAGRDNGGGVEKEALISAADA